MAILPASIPVNDMSIGYQQIAGVPVQLVSGVTLTTPTSATYVTGLTVTVAVPQLAQFIAIHVNGTNATVTAAATVTLGAYIGATAGTLTTLFGSSVVVAPTGGTTVGVNSTFWLPVTSTMWGTSVIVSIGATASSGNYVLNASSTSPATLIALAY